MKAKNSDIVIDYNVQLADVVQEAAKYFPLGLKKEQILCYWNYQHRRLMTYIATDTTAAYESHLRFKLLSLCVLIPEQLN